MIDTFMTERSDRWSRLPLCRSYLAARFDTATVEIEDAASPMCAHWGFGTLADGQREVLGVWVGAQGDASAWQRISQDLWVRGVERIRYVIASQAAGLTTRFPSATVLLSAEDAPVVGLSPRLRRTVLDGDRVKHHLRNSLRRALGLHGAFADREGAAASLSQVLERAEQRLANSRLMRAPTIGMQAKPVRAGTSRPT